MLYDSEDKLTKEGERRVGYDNVRGLEDFYTFRGAKVSDCPLIGLCVPLFHHR